MRTRLSAAIGRDARRFVALSSYRRFAAADEVEIFPGC